MDLKSKSRTWVGNIYHKFEAICHEVDEFVTKDTAKYLENQVHTVNESVKKIYSNVLHDLHPTLGDSVQTKAHVVTKKQDDATGPSIRSVVSVKEKPTHYCEMQLSEELDPVNLVRNCNSSEVESIRQFRLSPDVDFPEDEENGSHWEEGSDAAFPKTTMVVVKNVGEDYWETSHLSHPKDVNSSELLLHSKEQHLLTKNVESPDDRNLSLPSDMSNSQDKRSISLADLPRNAIEDVGLRTLQKEETKCNSTDLSEKVETGFSLAQGDDTPICKNSEMGVEENAMIVEHPACENVSCSEDNNSYQFLCVQEQITVANYLCSPEDKSLSFSSSDDEDHKCAVLVKHLQEIVVPDERISCVSMIETMDDYVDLSEKVKTNLPLEQGGLGLEVNLTKEHPLVDSGSAPNYRSSSELSLFLREQHSLTDESSSVKDESLPKIPLISTNENSKVTAVDKFLPETTVSDEWLGILEDEEGVFSRKRFAGEAETDFPFDSYHSCMLSELGLEENGLVQKHSLKEHLVNNTGFRPLHKDDEATYAKFSAILSASNVPPDLVSSNIFQVHHVVQSEASSSSLSKEFSHANYIEKTEKTCRDCTHSSCSALDLSTISYVSLSDLGSNDKTGNQIPAFSRTASSADDLAVDIVDANLETIDLSDKANPVESCSIVDDELLYTPSFRCRKFRSYKELIKEAFASRKRLVKEYKQLPIWYGDLDTETSLPSEKHLLPHTALSSASASTLTSSHPCNIGESDWELL